MILLAATGVALLVGAPIVGYLLGRRGRDSVALVRILQLAGVGLLLAALLIRPYNPATRAIPPPPDAPAPLSR